MALYESGGAGEKLLKRPIRTENATRISEQGGNSAATGIPELEQMSKQMIVTRFKSLHPTTMEDLPDELLINICIRLLAKQLAQMRSVSKSWNGLLSHPSFVKSHLHRSICNNNEQILLVFHNYFAPLTQYSCKSPHLERISFIRHTPCVFPSRVVGSINGLICLSTVYNIDIQIWNPSLSAISNITPPQSITMGFLYPTFIRFGFDPKSDDYKLVFLTDLRDTSLILTSVKESWQVEIYSMRKGTWDLITQPFPSHITRIFDTDYLCVDGHDGHLHWQIETVVKTEETILALDLGSETFNEIRLPDSILDSNHKSHELGVLGGKLCEMTLRNDGAWEVWVMEEYGVPESWVKRHVFSQFNDAVCFYGFTLRSELLLRDKDRRLVLYDPTANKTKLSRMSRIEQSANKVMEYVDSLVWV